LLIYEQQRKLFKSNSSQSSSAVDGRKKSKLVAFPQIQFASHSSYHIAVAAATSTAAATTGFAWQQSQRLEGKSKKRHLKQLELLNSLEWQET